MNLSIWDAPKEYYMIEKPRRPFPVMPLLTHKRKGEAPKCKTCKHFKENGAQWGWCTVPMQMACDRYKRKKKKK